MNFLMFIPGLFEVLEKVVGPLFTSGTVSTITKGVLGLGSGISSSGVLGVIEGALGKLDDEKVAAIKAEVETLLAQSQVEQAEISSPKPWYTVPHEVAEMCADLYLATGFVIGILHISLFMFGIVVPFAGYDNVTVGIALSFSGLVKTYKALT